jgi:hypothetical protein
MERAFPPRHAESEMLRWQLRQLKSVELFRPAGWIGPNLSVVSSNMLCPKKIHADERE